MKVEVTKTLDAAFKLTRLMGEARFKINGKDRAALTQGDFVELALGATETTETNLGTITVPSAGVRAIVGVYGVLEEITTTAEQGVGYFRLAFKTVAGSFKFPCATYQAPAGTLASPGFMYEPKIIPVNIPVPANETITCYMATFVAATGACRGMVGVIFE